MTTVKQLLAIAAISIAALAPASAQVSGGFAFRMPIFNSNSEQVFNGIPSGRMTSIYDLTGRYISRVHAKAVIDGQVISLLDLHIGCTDPVNAERAFVTPNIADSTRCEILLTSIPYTIVRNATPE